MGRSSLVRALLAAALSAATPGLAGLVAPAYAAEANPGYWLVASDGGIFSYGGATFHGSTGAMKLNQPIVGMASTPSGRGYWLLASDGGIFSYGDAAFHGSTGAMKLNQPIVGMASTPSGLGYWLVASDGGIFSYGDAAFHGSTGAMKLNQPIVGMASTPSGRGYWLVASDGGIFSYGDATFHGSTGAIKLNQPIVSMTSTRSGNGYWLASADGGIFSYGDAAFHGSAANAEPSGRPRQIVSMVRTASGAGYWQISAAGELFAYGDAAHLGAPTGLSRGLVGMTTSPLMAAQSTDPGPGAPPGAPPGPPPGPAPEPYRLPQFFSSVPNPTWGTGESTVEDKKAGRVYALAEAGDKVFVGGEFESMVPPGKNPGPGVARKFLAAIDRNTGQLLDWEASPDNVVLSLAVSPDARTLYVGGRFSQIGGAPAGRIAALDVETGRQIASFTPPAADAGVRAMTLRGNTLYIGGVFEHLGGVAREQLAALDATTGELRSDWVGPNSGDECFTGQTGNVTSGCKGFVHDLAISDDGSLLYVAGSFADFGGTDHGGLLTVDGATGEATDWQADNDRPVFGVAIWPGDGKSAVASTGGTGGQAHFYEYKEKKRSSKPKWVHKVDGDAVDVVATRERVYLVGHYDFVLGKKTVCGAPPCKGSEADGDQPNRHLSAFDARTGSHDLSFTAQANTPQGPYVALVGRDHLYVGGDFTNIDIRAGGQEFIQPGFVQFPAVEPRG